MKELEELPKNVYSRLEFIEFLLRFRGGFARSDLTDRFGIGEAAATRDIKLYKDLAEQNLFLNQVTKKYEIPKEGFSPIFELRSQSALSKLRTGKISEMLGMSDYGGVLTIPRLVLPDVDILSTITRAICSGRTIKAGYTSIGNGKSEKELIPHALFDNGIHWYVRAFDVSKEEKPFRSYALTRFVDAKIDYERKPQVERKALDHQWNRIVNLELVPHPNSKNVSSPETVERDYGMRDGSLTIEARAAIAGYWLYHWSVDCTEDHSLEGYNYQLWLRNHQSLYDVESSVIAPGLSDYHEK